MLVEFFGKKKKTSLNCPNKIKCNTTIGHLGNHLENKIKIIAEQGQKEVDAIENKNSGKINMWIKVIQFTDPMKK